MDKARAHVLVKGRVQGVFFRSSTRQVALKNGVNGWVKNLKTGEVEAILEGQQNAVKSVIEFMKVGPANACVDKLTVDFQEFNGEFNDFSIVY